MSNCERFGNYGIKNGIFQTLIAILIALIPAMFIYEFAWHPIAGMVAAALFILVLPFRIKMIEKWVNYDLLYRYISGTEWYYSRKNLVVMILETVFFVAMAVIFMKNPFTAMSFIIFAILRGMFIREVWRLLYD